MLKFMASSYILRSQFALLSLMTFRLCLSIMEPGKRYSFLKSLSYSWTRYPPLAWKEIIRNISLNGKMIWCVKVFIVLIEIQKLKMMMSVESLFPPFNHSFINLFLHLGNKFRNSSELDTFLSTQNLKQKSLNFLQISNNQ